MKVQVIKAAFVSGSLVQPGAVLDLEDGAKGSWFRPLTPDAPAKDMRKPVKKQETKALSELNKSATQSMLDVMSQPDDEDGIA